ncbi:MAG: VOC family protein [Actinomycetota bacterium]|nr:VOC family protein [Actinomycetota bacterium]
MLGLIWLGTRTERFEEMTRFAHDVLGLEREFGEDGMAGYKLPDGSLFEIFGPGHAGGGHPPDGVAGGFRVDDLKAAIAELEAAGLEVQPLQSSGGSIGWVYFRAPDGNLYELIGPS